MCVLVLINNVRACTLLQAGRRLAGYSSIHEGGVAPILVKAIPQAERFLFKVYAQRLLDGPPVSNELKWLLALVVLLRHADVLATVPPSHGLVLSVDRAAAEVGVPADMLQRWMESISQNWVDENTRALSLSQVSVI